MELLRELPYLLKSSRRLQATVHTQARNKLGARRDLPSFSSACVDATELCTDSIGVVGDSLAKRHWSCGNDPYNWAHKSGNRFTAKAGKRLLIFQVRSKLASLGSRPLLEQMRAWKLRTVMWRLSVGEEKLLQCCRVSIVWAMSCGSDAFSPHTPKIAENGYNRCGYNRCRNDSSPRHLSEKCWLGE